jgi:hypothetical protein
MPGQLGGYPMAQFNESRTNLRFEAAAWKVAGRTGTSDGHDFGAVGQDKRDGNGVNVGLPQPHDDAKALSIYVANGLIDFALQFRPALPVMLAHLLDHRFSLVPRERREEGPAERGGGHTCARSGVNTQCDHRTVAVTGFQMDHIQPLAFSQGDQGVAGIRESLHRRSGDFAHVEISEDSVT